MKRYLAVVMVLIIMISTMSFAVDAASSNSAYLGGIEDQTGCILPDDDESFALTAGTRVETREMMGTEHLIVTLNAERVTDLLTTYGVQWADNKSFTKADISDDGFVYYIWSMSNTMDCQSKAGICYYWGIFDTFYSVHASYSPSGVVGYSSNISKSFFDASKVYYGFVKNEEGEGVTKGWLKIYYFDPD